MQPETSNVAAVVATVPDFYFTCSITKCTLRASACEKNRLEASKVDSLILIKQSSMCKNCKVFESEQKATAISVEAFHNTVLSDAANQERTPYVRSQFIRSQEWEGQGRNKTRISN